MDPRLANLLRRQHGAATHAQVTGTGATRGQLLGWIRRGRLLSPWPGIVVAPGAPPTPQQEAMIAVLRCGPGARLIGPRALALLGIRGFGRTDPFGVLLAPGRNPRARHGLATFPDPRPDDGHALADGVPIPRSARSVVEVSRWLSGSPLRSAVDAALWSGRPTREQLVEVAFALPRTYVPAARIRDLVRAGHLEVESEPERRLRDLLDRSPYGPFEPQVWVSSRRRVDLLARRHRLVVEYDGRDHRTDDGRRRDELRDRELEGLGYLVVHVHHEDLAHPNALLERIEARLLWPAETGQTDANGLQVASARHLDRSSGPGGLPQARASRAAARKTRAR